MELIAAAMLVLAAGIQRQETAPAPPAAPPPVQVAAPHGRRGRDPAVRGPAAPAAESFSGSGGAGRNAPPYREEEVRFASAPGVDLAGTLTLPRGPGPFPAALLITGSGPQDRDAAHPGHRPFRVLADHLARRGIAVLRVDDRGVGRSTGQAAAATLADVADDTEAGLRFLGGRAEVAAGKTGLVGHSEGGMIAPLVAERSGRAAFVVLLAAPGVPGDSVLALQGAAIVRAAGGGPEAVRTVREVQSRVFEAVRAGGDSARVAERVTRALAPVLPPGFAWGAGRADSLPPEVQPLLTRWFGSFIAYDPRPALRRLRVPTLAVNGTLDVQVPARENLSAIEQALREAGNQDHAVVELPGLNHFFQTARTGALSEYPGIAETLSPALLEVVTGWIARRFGECGEHPTGRVECARGGATPR